MLPVKRKLNKLSNNAYKLSINILGFLKIISLIRNIATKFKIIEFWNFLSHLKKAVFYSQFIGKGDLVFDIGANIGDYTRTFLQLGAKVICVEPEKGVLKRLEELFGKNKNVTIVRKAVGDKEGYDEFFICEEIPAISTLSQRWKSESRYSKDFKWIKTQRVAITTVDTLIQLYGLPKFCKIDVEGFELQVLKGLTKKIPYLCFEFTREFFDVAKKCVNYLLSLGPVKFNCVLYNSIGFYFSKWVAPDKLYQDLTLIEDDLLWGDIYAKIL